MNNYSSNNQIVFCKKFADAIFNECAAVFVGAGMSKPCGLPTWKELLQSPLEEIGLNVDKETDLISVAQFYANTKSRRSDLTQHTINLFTSKRAQPSEAHRLLASLPIKKIWTTNYDTLLEQAYAKQGKKIDVKRKSTDLCYPIPGSDVIINKMHGDISLASEITLISEDYESYHSKNELFSNNLKTDLASKTFLFIGFSMSDPNILSTLGYMRERLSKHIRTHFCIYKNIQEDDYSNHSDFAYFRNREELWIENLKRYGIEVVRINEYSEINNILRTIKKIILSKSVFISGSAEVYETLSKEDGENFIHQLAYKLAKNGYKIVSGFGLGVGSSVINGVLTRAYEEGQTIDGKLICRPFPINIKDPVEKKEKWKKYREDMIALAGNAIFIFGNKRMTDTTAERLNIVSADGMIEEFKIAQAQGLRLFPIGQTGYTSRTLWGKVSEDMSLYYPTQDLQNEVQIMNDIPLNHTEKLVDAIINCIQKSQPF